MDPAVATRIQDLNRFREMASRREVAPSVVFTWYGSLIAAVNDSASKRLEEGMVEVGLQYEYVTHLREAIEHLAQIRGIVNGALLATDDDPAWAVELTRQITLHREYLSLFERAAPAAALAKNAFAIAAQPVKRTIEIAEQIVDGQNAESGMSPASWWRLASQAIDTMQAAATAEARYLGVQADLRMRAIERQMQLFVAVLVVLGLLTLGLALATVTRIVHGLNALLSGLDGVASRGNFNTRIELKRSDEFTTISGGINKLIAIAAAIVAEREKDSLTDALTGLLNRRGMKAQLEARLHPDRHHAQPSCVMMIDADHFKRVNDNFGHPEGDRVLKILGGFLAEQIRADDVAGRYGGEEFIGLLVGCNLETAQLIAEKLRRRVAEFDFGLGSTVTISIGLAEWRVGLELDVLVTRADSALYRAKSGGRNQVIAFYQDESKLLPASA